MKHAPSPVEEMVTLLIIICVALSKHVYLLEIGGGGGQVEDISS